MISPDDIGRPSTTERIREEESFSREKDLSETKDSLMKFEVAPESIIARVEMEFPLSSTRSTDRMRCSSGSDSKDEEEIKRGSEDSSERIEK